MKISIEMQKKDLYLLSIILVFFVATGFVVAYNSVPSVPSVMGHSAGELDLDVKGILYNLQQVQNLGLFNSSSTPSGGGGLFIPSSVIRTTAAHNGNFGGYVAMKTWIQANGCAGYHVCDGVELFHYVEAGNTPANVVGWYTEGSGEIDVDCGGGWTSSSNGRSGRRWQGSRPLMWFEGGSNRCDASYVVWCCK